MVTSGVTRCNPREFSKFREGIECAGSSDMSVGATPVEILLRGLRHLEYRGYDSAGIAWRDGGGLRHVRAVGNIDSLDAALATHRGSPAADPALGIAHTRWATHGAVTEANAHPHADCTNRFLIVLNGIIENHVEIRRRLAAKAIACRSQTDAEVVAHLVGLYYDGDLADAVRRTTRELSGHYAVVAVCADEPDTLVGVRRECPLSGRNRRRGTVHRILHV